MAPNQIGVSADRILATVVNGIEVARYGGLKTEHNPSPYRVEAHEPMYRLRHYFPESRRQRPPVVLVPPLSQVAEVWDISPDTSAVSMLHAQGLDPWVIDFGDPAVEPGGNDRTFGDHVLAVVSAAQRVRQATGRDVHLIGYSQGGIFCYTAAAYLGSAGVASVITLGSALTTLDADRVIPQELFWDLVGIERKIVGKTGLPKWFVRQMFNWASPAKNIRNDIDFLLALHDRDSLLPREPQRKFLKRDAWITWPGPALAELLHILQHNRLVEGGVVIGDRTIGLADITCPILILVGETDFIAPPATVRIIGRAAPNAEIYEIALPVGHFGLPVSSHARRTTWPGVGAWVRWTAGKRKLPDYIHELSPSDLASDHVDAPRGHAAGLMYGTGLLAEAGLKLPATLARTGRGLASTVADLSREAAVSLPHLVRLESMTPRSRVSYAGLLDDLARSHPDQVAFLFADRAHTHGQAKQRIDSVVRGLISAGVRRGERVGVLMNTRPSALVAIAALNRIGAVAVLHRGSADLQQEVRLGKVTKIVADPEHAGIAAAVLPTLVLGAAHEEREITDGAVDLERIDPDAVQLPDWYRPNPGRADDVAFVLFRGAGDQVRADLITNGRWATSALAATVACALTRGDTLYSTSPLHHPTGLLLASAAATASGCRLALAGGFDPHTFWSEVRRYRATVVTYTRDMLEPLVDASVRRPRSHPIRLFVGSAMSADLWQRVTDQFGEVRVLEMYASTRSDAILGNINGRKIGSVGKPLPGTPRVCVVAMEDGRIRTRADGYAVRANPGEVGQLLVNASGKLFAGNEVPMRGLFAPNDAWVATDDLFRVDADGDFWFVGSVSDRAATSVARVTSVKSVATPKIS
jgi:putative long chain acyl-CoA synthase